VSKKERGKETEKESERKKIIFLIMEKKRNI
jgi:hypothetical protein